jgi:hypothetical protein
VRFAALAGFALLAGDALGQSAEGYSVVRAPAPRVVAGKRATLSLTLLPDAGHRLLADGPVDVRLASDGVALPKPLLHREDAVDPRAEAPRFEVPIDPRTAGPARLTARLTFYLCKAERCRPVETTTEWSFDVVR